MPGFDARLGQTFFPLYFSFCSTFFFLKKTWKIFNDRLNNNTHIIYEKQLTAVECAKYLGASIDSNYLSTNM